MKYCIDNDKVQWDYMKAFTNASYIVKDGFGYQEGLFTGYDAEKRDYDRSTWDYVLGDDGFVVTDPTLQHSRCVWNLLKAHLAPYTPEMVERICGTPKDKFLKVAEMISECSSPTKTMTSMYALGWTQHSSGSQNIRAMAMLQLILGNIGVRGGGMNALRGHSNIQGLTDLGLMSHLLTGYLTMPTEKDVDFTTYMSTRQFKPLRPGQTSYWQNYRKFMVSFQKAMWGDAARIDNDWAFNYLSKLDVPAYDVLRVFELMYAGKVNGYICQGFNPLLAFPNRDKNTKALRTSNGSSPWTRSTQRPHGSGKTMATQPCRYGIHPDRGVQLPTTCFAEEEGSLTNSGRWLQWHWAGGTPPGEAKHDTYIVAQIFLRMKEMYRSEGGAFPDPILNLSWDYADPNEPTPEELAKEINGRALTDLMDPADPMKVQVAAGKQILNFSQLRDDGSTMCGCWIYSGNFNEQGNNMARRDNHDPDDTGAYLGWSFAWPLNRRTLYNRASADLQGKPWDPSRKLLEWDGTKWTGYDVPDIAPTAKPDEIGPFIMNQEGTARLFSRGLMRDGPFPAHMEPFESPVANVFNPKMRGNPVSRVFQTDVAQMGLSDEFPYAATSYRLTEHFHYWTKHNRVNSAFSRNSLSRSPRNWQRRRISKTAAGSGVVEARFGQGKGRVTKRIRPLMCDGKPVHVVGIPLHWGFTGSAKKGLGPNSLAPFVGDANIETPEYKAFLVNIEPSTAPEEATV